MLEQAQAGGDAHWSTRSMARSQGMSQSAVSRIWRAFGLRAGQEPGAVRAGRDRR